MDCKSCKHWNVNDAARLYEAPKSHGMCDKIPSIDCGHINKISGMAVVPADFDYMPLITRHDFFCAMHENKQESE
jgi:hypothetical protein